MTTSYDRYFASLENTVDYWREAALNEFVVDFTTRMRKQGITKATIADMLGRSRAYVTQTLRGDGNLTLETLVRFAMAVGGVIHVHIANRGALTTWVDEEVGRGADSQRANMSYGDGPQSDDVEVVRDARPPLAQNG